MIYLHFYNILCILFLSASASNEFYEIVCEIKCIESNHLMNGSTEICEEQCNEVFENENNSDTNLETQVIFSERNLSKPVVHCLTENSLTVTWQPWHIESHQNILYFLRLQNKTHQWFYREITNKNNITFEHLFPETEYQVQLWAVNKNENFTIYGPTTSSWLTTLAEDGVLKPVKNISLSELRFQDGKFLVFVQWVPDTEYPACYYELVYFNHGGSGYYQQIEFIDPLQQFQIVFEEKEFDSNFSIRIMAKSKNWEKESKTISAYFYTPSCLDIIGNLSICAPSQPANLTFDEKVVNIVTKNKSQSVFYDITIHWGLPKYLPDFYDIKLLLFPSNDMHNNYRLNITVLGNVTKAVFRNVEVGLRYIVSVIAYSEGGISEPAIIHRQITQPQIPISQKHMWYATVIVLIIIIIFILSVISIYIYHRRAKKKRYERRCKYFEDLEEKAPKSIDCITSGTELIIKDVNFEVDKWEIIPERLVLQSVLGEGAFGVVRRAWLWNEKSNSSIEVAVKMLKVSPSIEETRQFLHEIEIMKTVGHHANLVSLIGCCTRSQTNSNMLLVVEFCPLGDLQNYLRNIWERITSRPEPSNIKYADLMSPTSSEGSANLFINKLYDIEISESEFNIKPHDLLSFARQIAVGMEFLASMKVIHRDVAARNVLVCYNKIVKIADFGLSRDVYKENLYRKSGNGRLPIRWMALESLTHQLYTTQSDVWSFGILLWEIVTLGGNPYPSIPTNALIKYLKAGYRMERPSNCGNELYSIMLSCWKLRAKDRPTFTQLRKSLDELLESVTNTKYLDLDVLTSTEFASFRVPLRDTSMLSLKSRNKSPEKHSSDRYVHPVMLNNAKNSTGNSDVSTFIK